MEASVRGIAKQGQDLANQGQDLADSASDKAQSLRSAAKPLVDRATSQATSMGRQGLDTISDMTDQARDAISNASSAVVSFTKKNPAAALGIAAAGGVIAYALIKSWSARD